MHAVVVLPGAGAEIAGRALLLFLAAAATGPVEPFRGKNALRANYAQILTCCCEAAFRGPAGAILPENDMPLFCV